MTITIFVPVTGLRVVAGITTFCHSPLCFPVHLTGCGSVSGGATPEGSGPLGILLFPIGLNHRTW